MKGFLKILHITSSWQLGGEGVWAKRRHVSTSRKEFSFFHIAVFGLKDTLTRTIPCLLLDTCACKEITQSVTRLTGSWTMACQACMHTCTHMFTLCARIMASVVTSNGTNITEYGGTAHCKPHFHNHVKSPKILNA